MCECFTTKSYFNLWYKFIFTLQVYIYGATFLAGHIFLNMRTHCTVHNPFLLEYLGVNLFKNANWLNHRRRSGVSSLHLTKAWVSQHITSAQCFAAHEKTHDRHAHNQSTNSITIWVVKIPHRHIWVILFKLNRSTKLRCGSIGTYFIDMNFLYLVFR